MPKNPLSSASPLLRFFRPDATSAPITGSSPGVPRARAPCAIQTAIAELDAVSPGYPTGESQSSAPAAAWGWAAAADGDETRNQRESLQKGILAVRQPPTTVQSR
jgi:hypothetical protein